MSCAAGAGCGVQMSRAQLEGGSIRPSPDAREPCSAGLVSLGCALCERADPAPLCRASRPPLGSAGRRWADPAARHAVLGESYVEHGRGRPAGHRFKRSGSGEGWSGHAASQTLAAHHHPRAEPGEPSSERGFTFRGVPGAERRPSLSPSDPAAETCRRCPSYRL
jgi:hypothetical protein